MSVSDSPGLASNSDLRRFFHVGDDKRREILRALGLPAGRRSHDWSEVWAALGLEPRQPRRLWDRLSMPLLTLREVARRSGVAESTLNGWCLKDEFPEGFPAPIRLGPRTKRWIGLEVAAYRQPSLYAKDARGIRRPARGGIRKKLQPAAPMPTTLDPLPPQG